MTAGRALLAEQAVVGAVFLKPEILDWLDISERDFAEMIPRTVFAAALESKKRHGTVDPTLVEAELRRSGRWEAIGTKALRECVDASATTANVEHYATLVRSARLTRDVAAAAQSILRRATEAEGTELLEFAQAALGDVALPPSNRATTLGELRREEVQAIGRALNSPDEATEDSVVATGLEKLDGIIGGLARGLVNILAGRPGRGKSTFVLQVASNVAKRGGKAAIVSYEDKGPTWARRSLAGSAGVDVDEITERRVSAANYANLVNSGLSKKDPVASVRILPAHGLSPERALRSALSLLGDKPDVVFLDYIQNAVRARAGMKKNELIESFLVYAQELAAKSNAAIVVCSQFKRLEKGEPTMDDLKESGALEEAGKLILGIDHVLDPLGDPVEGQARFLVLKHHARRARRAVTVGFNGPFARFE